MAFSKVILNGETLMDVTGDNPTSSNMLTGTKATGADGRSVNGAVVTAPASDNNPAMDGTASAGSASTYSRGDHVHPSDTSKLDKSGGTMTGALTLSGAPTANLHAVTKKYVDDAIGGINSFEYEVVQSLPTTNIKDHTIYLVPKTGTTGDVYDEYLRISNAWEHIGSTDVDLSGYVPTSRTVNGKALSSNISLTASDVGALPSSTTIPSATSDLTNDSNFVADANYVHTDNNFTDALATKLNGIAEGATVDDHKWNDVVLNKTEFADDGDYYIPSLLGTSAISAGLLRVNQQVVNRSIPRRTSAGFIISKTPTAGDNTTKVATTAFVKSAVDTAVSGKQDKPTITSATLAVASWSNGVYSFESTYPNASYNIDIEPDGYTITDAQFNAWNEAKIVGNSNGNTIKALGTVPTVAIPIVVRATPK